MSTLAPDFASLIRATLASKKSGSPPVRGRAERLTPLRNPERLMPSNAFHIAVVAGDGIGPEVMAPALEVLRKIEATSDLTFRFTEAPAGANHYRETGKSMPESTARLCDEPEAI